MSAIRTGLTLNRRSVVRWSLPRSAEAPGVSHQNSLSGTGSGSLQKRRMGSLFDSVWPQAWRLPAPMQQLQGCSVASEPLIIRVAKAGLQFHDRFCRFLIAFREAGRHSSVCLPAIHKPRCASRHNSKQRLAGYQNW